MRNFSKIIVTLALMGSMNLYADHREDRDRCTNSVRFLERSVKYSSLRYQVKRAVKEFTRDYYQAQECLVDDRDDYGRDRNRFPLFPRRHSLHDTSINIENKDHDNCDYYLSDLRRSFSEVDRYLYDTYYDYPRVFNAYNKVKRELDFLLYGRF